MFLGLMTAVFLHITYVRGDECPNIDQIKPCECKFEDPRFVVSCNGSQVDEIAKVLANINHTDADIQMIRLTNVWLPNLPPNFLQGPNIQSITINNCSLSSVDKDAFAHMESTLSQLRLCVNDLERVPSHALENLSQLKVLFLDVNRIERVDAGAFKGLYSIRYLSLHTNKIKFLDNLAFMGLGSHFIYLNLLRNELTTAPCLALRNHPSLKALLLYNNKIAELNPKEFNAMGGESLVNLNIANNRIRNLPAGTFATMKALSNLSLSGNSIESIHPSAFQGIEGTLETLLLRDNRLEEVPSAAVEKMRVLKTLDFRDNKICKIRKDDFLQYGESLVTVDLRNNTLVYLDPESLIPLKSLKFLWMSSNQLKTVTRDTIAPVLGTLKFLDITDNPLHCDCSLSWIQDTMERSSIEDLKCATPKEHANTSLALIPVDQLVCENGTSNKPVESCCNCKMNTTTLHQNRDHQSSDAIMSGYSYFLVFTYLSITVAKRWLL